MRQAAASISPGSISAQETSDDHYQQGGSSNIFHNTRKKAIAIWSIDKIQNIKNMKKLCQNHNYSEKQFRGILL